MSQRDLEDAFDTYQYYMEDFERRGTRQSAVQARKALSLVMKYAKEVRQEIQDEVNRMKAERASRKGVSINFDIDL